jgi:hypothetical protein
MMRRETRAMGEPHPSVPSSLSLYFAGAADAPSRFSSATAAV